MNGADCFLLRVSCSRPGGWGRLLDVLAEGGPDKSGKGYRCVRKRGVMGETEVKHPTWWSDTAWGTCILHWNVWVHGAALLPLHLPANTDPTRQHVTRVLGPLPATWRTAFKFLVSDPALAIVFEE